MIGKVTQYWLGDRARVLGSDTSKGCASSCVNTRKLAGIVVRVEATLVVTADIQTLNYTAIFAQGAAFCVGNNAVDGYQDVTGNGASSTVL